MVVKMTYVVILLVIYAAVIHWKLQIKNWEVTGTLIKKVSATELEL